MTTRRKRAGGNKSDRGSKDNGDGAEPAKDAAGAQEVSESERLLFGGPLRYDMGWNHHHGSFLELGLRAMVLRMPRLIGSTVRLAHRAGPERPKRTSWG